MKTNLVLTIILAACVSVVGGSVWAEEEKAAGHATWCGSAKISTKTFGCGSTRADTRPPSRLCALRPIPVGFARPAWTRTFKCGILAPSPAISVASSFASERFAGRSHAACAAASTLLRPRLTTDYWLSAAMARWDRWARSFSSIRSMEAWLRFWKAIVRRSVPWRSLPTASGSLLRIPAARPFFGSVANGGPRFSTSRMKKPMVENKRPSLPNSRSCGR